MLFIRNTDTTLSKKLRLGRGFFTGDCKGNKGGGNNITPDCH